MASLNYILLQYEGTSIMFSIWSGPSRSLMERRRKMGRRRKMAGKRKRDKAPIDGVPFKEQSIFYKYLPYWANLEVRHAIDGMHLKKNVFGNIIGLLLEISTKTKDTLKSCQDLLAMKIRQDLHPVDKGNGRYELPPASYNLTRDEKKAMCESLRGI